MAWVGQLQILLLLLLLLLVSGVICPQQFHNNTVPMRCSFMLLKSESVFERRCNGTYPLVASLKFQDKLIRVGEPVSLYMTPSRESVLVVHKASPLHKCYILQFHNSNTFHCLDDNRNETIFLPRTNLFCVPFHFKLQDDLMHECAIENHVKQELQKQYLSEVLRTRRTVLHYTYGVGGAQALRISMLLSFPPLLLLLL